MSDWSSDVCSSDLAGPRLEQRVRARGDGGGRRGGGGRFGGGCDAHLAITHHHRGGCKQDRQRTDERLRGARHKHISPEDKVSNETMSGAVLTGDDGTVQELGRASCRARVCQYV